MLGGDGAGAIDGGGGQGVVGDTVDEPWQSAGAVGQRLDGGGFEQGVLAAGQPQSVGEVVVEFLAVESGEVVAHDEALGERFVHGHGQAPAQLGESDEQQAQAVLGVHGEVTQQAKVFQDVVSQVLGFVDDEHGELLGLAEQTGDFFADGAVGGGARAFGGKPQLPSDGLVHVEDVSGGERDVADAVQSGMQGGGDVSAHGGFARADLAGHQTNALELDEVMEPRLGLAARVRLEQLIGVGRGLEGHPGQGEVTQVHQLLSSRFRIVRGEGDGCDGGVSHWICQDGRSRLTVVLA